jgi:hypothetical protein
MITLEGTAGSNATFKYSLNGGNFEPYTGAFPADRQNDKVIVSVLSYATGTHTFLRWNDGTGIIVGDQTGAELDLSLYGESVTITAMFTETPKKVEITLAPSGAELYYKIGTLDEVRYTVPFLMDRNEKLVLRSAGTFGTGDFVRWEGPSITTGSAPTVSITLPATGDEFTYTAVYAVTADMLTISLAANGATAQLKYRVNDIEYDYTVPFTVDKKNDKVEISAIGPSGYTFLRWNDGTKIIPGDEKIDISTILGNYGATVTFTAVFAEDVYDLVTITLDPNGAELYYKIGTLDEMRYTVPFLMDRNEKLVLRSATANA